MVNGWFVENTHSISWMSDCLNCYRLLFYQDWIDGMAKRVFFSFHYQDVMDFRAKVVRNHWVTKPDREAAGFFDASVWESAKKSGELSVKRLINSAIRNTSATVVLIGAHTYSRRWVRCEVMKSIEKWNILVGIHINSIPDKYKSVKPLGQNPLEYLAISIERDGSRIRLVECDRNRWWCFRDSNSPCRCNYRLPTRMWGKCTKLSEIFPVYDWIAHGGYSQFAEWVGNDG